MHPALSVIVFTTASGAGYGLLALLGILAPLGFLPAGSGFGFAATAGTAGLAAPGVGAAAGLTAAAGASVGATGVGPSEGGVSPGFGAPPLPGVCSSAMRCECYTHSSAPLRHAYT